ncbi:uridine nucleosidase [Gaeumannomyces tritici R3-111a-1]|uniref:Uridine nucleosidase n=1 Tax=Gaeumannomyces tritici (strain R3-111a-1) TaxID=644352 RepID=J3NJC1_GAET3|nr:uridine nucleosidase [Gaeumannomyces tritici R3-111a-1]EJT81372.1 uridine nucleosidase [Gaeumannomyces tritici R3-111a-1]
MATQPQAVPLWLDCDPGHDDAFAILLAAYHPMIKLLGISTVFGNASLEKTTYNATSILTAIGKYDQVAVYPGAAKASVRPPLHAPTDIHGESGIDGTDLLPEPLRGPDRSVAAVDAMAAALLAQAPGTAWIIATGTVTNVAEAIAKYPQLVGHIAGLSIMGGAVGDNFTSAVMGQVDGVARIGNWTQWAEFNILVDPEAADSIFRNEALAKKTTIIPLDITHLVLATKDVQDLLLYGSGATPTAGGKPKTTLRLMLVQLLNFFAETYRTVFGIDQGPPLHDPVAVAVALQGLAGGHDIPFYDYDVRAEAASSSSPSPRRRERFAVTVNTEGTHEEAKAGAHTGRTAATLLPEGAEGVTIPRGLDIPKFWTVMEECLQRADDANAAAGRGP